ncbi:MAG: hypothetical protein WC322_07040 [Candidatus Paceibacterota bacterium]|jgi:hypothetical protein
MDELNTALVAIINKASGTLDAGMGFLTAQLPDVIHQLLLWKLGESLLECFAGLLVASIPTLLLYVTVKVTKGRGAKTKLINGTQLYKRTWSHNELGEPDVDHDVIFGTAIVFFVANVPALVTGLSMMNLTWLKVWLAPKIFLLEYAAQLLK